MNDMKDIINRLCDLERRMAKIEAQPVEQAEKQEPVAWMREDGTLLFADGNVFAVGQPLYTAPPKREWVGLTDEDDDELCRSFMGQFNKVDFARAIEAKLKERNNG